MFRQTVAASGTRYAASLGHHRSAPAVPPPSRRRGRRCLHRRSGQPSGNPLVPASAHSNCNFGTDPVVSLIDRSDRHFKAGQTELEQGHFEAAQLEFNRAVNVLLESPYGARTEPRIREHFDRLVDRISAYEVRALAAGDGFTEKKYEPASIDELLAMSTTFTTASPAASELKNAVQSDLAHG